MRSLSYLSLDPSLLRPVLLRRRQSKGLSFGASILSFEAVTSPEVAVAGTVGAVFVVSACGGALIWTLQLVIFSLVAASATLFQVKPLWRWRKRQRQPSRFHLPGLAKRFSSGGGFRIRPGLSLMGRGWRREDLRA
ncbi:hypothetical protein KSP40_PGU019031 [Platanthera guangdongensis]|uniref:Uncharacterized protein n=1 Tax=Platanthera guangdongensis TaxID=2320717 RepID=A0ABR2MN80_9ASPA